MKLPTPRPNPTAVIRLRDVMSEPYVAELRAIRDELASDPAFVRRFPPGGRRR